MDTALPHRSSGAPAGRNGCSGEELCSGSPIAEPMPRRRVSANFENASRIRAFDSVRIFGHDGKRVPRKSGFETETENEALPHLLVLFFTLNREDFSFVIHLDRQPRTSRRREAQTGSRARSGSRSERTLDAVEHSRTLMEWWPFLICHRGGLRIKVINNTRSVRPSLNDG